MTSDSDPQLDEHLRAAPLPDGMLARLRRIADEPQWDEARIDTELQQVEMPAGFTQRLRELGSDLAADHQQDVVLNQVEIPWGLQARLKNIAAARPVFYGRRLAVAALLLLTLNLVQGALLTGAAWVGRPPAQALQRVVVDSQPLNLTARFTPIFESTAALPAVTPRPAPVRLSPDLVHDATQVSLAVWEPDPPGPAGTLFRELAAGFHPESDLLATRYGLLTSPYSSAVDLPDLEVASTPQPRGMEPPLTPGFDRRFLLKNWTHPVVVPALNRKLLDSPAPFSTGSDSFEAAERQMQQGRWPDPRQVRVEDFLAATSVGLDAPAAGRLKPQLNAAPGLFRPSAHALYASVQAGPQSTRQTPAAHLTLVIDISAAPGAAQRLQMVREAVAELFQYMNGRDRLSILLVEDEPRMIIEGASRLNASEVHFALAQAEPAVSPDLSAGLHRALLTADPIEEQHTLAKRVLLVTDGRSQIAPALSDKLCELMRLSAEAEGETHIVTIGSREFPTAAKLCQAGGGNLSAARNARDLRYAMLRVVTGDSPVIAAEVTAQIHFNPQRVIAYRMLGHESVALGGLLSGEASVEIRALESAGVLFEVWLRGDGEGQVARLETHWRDPQTGESQTATAVLRASQVATEFAKGPPALQQAVLSAQVAEVLRDSPFAGERDLTNVRAALHEHESQLRFYPGYERLRQLVDRLSTFRRMR
ncbi:VWA domain-containing protein [Lignipirellula cremea]|uniref:VWFA domain-containing protein n=1 Tax=Lignipirellula cremea TaxID=2528010 RepID=A0A518DQR2_9BACT|nr:VWA domain-containing protein [Lignipirellula cremea]QDU94180.1 hypothetical protein Pla8534_19680 [Lignipirellula cremea]